jgi:YesN/AraC family two-component response regulator
LYRVLLVDDEPPALEGLQIMIPWEKEGFTVCGQCLDGAAALEAVKADTPDLIVTDLYMPGIGGIELMKKARDHGYQGAFVVVSGHQEFTLAREAMSFRVAGYLLKPLDPEEAVQTLTEVRLFLKENEVHSGAGGSESNRLFQAMRASVEVHFAQDISLLALGRELNHDPAYLGRVFRRETGQAFRPWLNEYRLNRAAERIRAEKTPIHRIAREAGYVKYAYFLEKFKQRFGVNPEEYRRSDKRALFE